MPDPSKPTSAPNAPLDGDQAPKKIKSDKYMVLQMGQNNDESQD